MSTLKDAKKGEISMKGYALLQWDFRDSGLPFRSVQLPEKMVDEILMLRDGDKLIKKLIDALESTDDSRIFTEN